MSTSTDSLEFGREGFFLAVCIWPRSLGKACLFQELEDGKEWLYEVMKLDGDCLAPCFGEIYADGADGLEIVWERELTTSEIEGEFLSLRSHRTADLEARAVGEGS